MSKLKNAYPVEEAAPNAQEWLNDLGTTKNPYSATLEKLSAEGKIPKHNYTLPTGSLSVSQVMLYLKCPQQYYRRYVLGEYSRPSSKMVQGVKIHKAVEVCYRERMLSKQVPAVELALDTYTDEINSLQKTELAFEEDAPDIETMKNEGIGLLKTWHAEKLSLTKPVAVEHKFLTIFGDVPVVGAIDLIDRVDAPLSQKERWEFNLDLDTHPMLDVVCDTKVVGKKISQFEANNSLQLTLYAHASGIPRQRLDMFIRTKVPKIETISSTRHQADVLHGIDIFKSVATAISAGSFPLCAPNQWYCGPKWCAYYANCRGQYATLPIVSL